MIKPLRTYHFFIWRILALVLPILFVLAILLRPESKDPHSSKNVVHTDSLKNSSNPVIRKQ